jgi:hypothetical protein
MPLPHELQFHVEDREMNPRRHFLRLFSASAPLAVAAAATGVARADDGNEKAFLGSWNVVSTISNGFSFREFFSFSDGGGFTETNSFLHTASNLNFAPFGLNVVANASDGFGNWSRTGPGTVKAVFRKLMFNSGTGQNFGDLHVTGTLMSEGDQLSAQWHVEIIDTAGNVLVDLGPVTSIGARVS